MSRFKLPNNTIVHDTTPFTLNVEVTVPVPAVMDGEEIVSPATTTTELQEVQFLWGVKGMSAEDRASYGITEIVEQPMPDSRYGIVSEDPETPGAWIVTPFTPEDMKNRLLAYAKEKRWQKEVGGIMVAGIAVATDDRSKMLIQGARASADADPAFTTPWAIDNQVITLDAATVVTLSNAVRDHVQECFNIFALVLADVQSGAITTYEAIEQAFA